MTEGNSAPQFAHLTGVARAAAVVQHMVEPGGCAWHAAQTHQSLTKYMVEEAYECAEAIDTGEATTVAEELGDVLYQVLFHAAIAEREREQYSLESIGEALADKLIARHPHVFADRGYMSESELNAEWEHLKEEAQGQGRGERHPLEGIPVGMAPLAKAAKIVERLKRARLLNPVSETSVTGVENEAAVGEAFLDLIIHANALGIDPERALRLATERLTRERVGPTPRS